MVANQAWCATWALALGLGAGVMACAKATHPFPDSYVGVGVELRLSGDLPEVVRVLEGGPAAAAGLKPGVRLTEVDGQPMAGVALPEVVGLLRGPPGSSVRVAATEGAQAYQVTLVRAALHRTPGQDYRAPSPAQQAVR
jgi:C-terminal processing protease CtpA/Prc